MTLRTIFVGFFVIAVSAWAKPRRYCAGCTLRTSATAWSIASQADLVVFGKIIQEKRLAVFIGGKPVENTTDLHGKEFPVALMAGELQILEVIRSDAEKPVEEEQALANRRPAVIAWKPEMLEGQTLELQDSPDTLKMSFSKSGDVQLEHRVGGKPIELSLGFGTRWEISGNGTLKLLFSGHSHPGESRSYELLAFSENLVVAISGGEKHSFRRYPSPLPGK